MSPPNVEFDLEAAANNHELSHSGRCFANRDIKADGRYNLKGRFQGSGISEELLNKATGHPMTITAAGEHDLQNGRISLSLLVAPLVTLNRVFEHIPLIGGVLETLDTIPLSVKGDSGAVHTIPLAPSAVGYALKEMMKKGVNRPIKLIHPGSGQTRE